MKPVYFPIPEDPPEDWLRYNRSGIDVQYNRRRDEITIGGWYDSCVGIEPTTLPLRDFLLKIGMQKRRVDAVCPNSGKDAPHD